MIKTQSAQKMGEYKKTDIDTRKENADFRLVQVCPFYITWKDGHSEQVTRRQLEKLQKTHTYAVDF